MKQIAIWVLDSSMRLTKIKRIVDAEVDRDKKKKRERGVEKQKHNDRQ